MQSIHPLTIGIPGKRALAALATVALTASAQAQFEARNEGVFRDRVDWGVMMDLSGPASGSQGIWTNGFQAYMRTLNEKGGVHGRRINVLAEDSRFNPAQDKINYEKLSTQTPVLAISGMGSSSSQVSLAPTIRGGKIPIVGTYTHTKPLSEPVSPLVYGGFCTYPEMAKAGVGYLTDKLKVTNPKVMVVSIESAGGVEYAQFIADAVKKYGGTSSLVTMKITAADVTPQVLEIIKQKPDFITIYGVGNTAILTMKAMHQYGLKIPAFGISYLMSPQIYAAIGPEAGAQYNVISCFTPGGADKSAGNVEMMAAADKYNHSAMKEDINYVAGWVAGQMAAQALQLAGPQPTRAKLVEAMSKGFTVNTNGLAAPIVFSPANQSGPSSFRMFGYDYAAKKYVAFGEFADYDKYMK
ncbi:MAG: ABC transporter substrate-binding protein [Burkholderiaceae bacterium]|jgi:ABC-type branched-subunit amino acid transport system substrate-binding protein